MAAEDYLPPGWEAELGKNLDDHESRIPEPPVRRSTAKHPTCPRCHKGGYTQTPNPYTDRPEFRCTRCDHTWSKGNSGGEYFVGP